MASAPILESGFDVYMNGGTLIYVKEPRAADDARGRFPLSLFPVDADDSPPEFRVLGHESLNFDFAGFGAVFDGGCVVARALPDYPIAAIETEQWIPGGETLWKAKGSLGRADIAR